MHALYVVFSYLAFAVLFPLLLLHRKTRSGLLQRFGFYSPRAFPAGGRPRIWLHGASAGDLLALSPMIRLLRLRFPSCTVGLSTVPNTGYLTASDRSASSF